MQRAGIRSQKLGVRKQNAEGRMQKSRVEVRRSDHGKKRVSSFDEHSFSKTPQRGVSTACGKAKFSKKRMSNFDEQSHYVIENKGSEKRTKPNKANFCGGKTLAGRGRFVTCGGEARRATGQKRCRGCHCTSLPTTPDSPPHLRRGPRGGAAGRGALRVPDDAGAGTAPLPKQECQAEARHYAARRTGRYGAVRRYDRAMSAAGR